TLPVLLGETAVLLPRLARFLAVRHHPLRHRAGLPRRQLLTHQGLSASAYRSIPSLARGRALSSRRLVGDFAEPGAGRARSGSLRSNPSPSQPRPASPFSASGL